MLGVVSGNDTSDLSARRCYMNLIRVCHTDRSGNMDYRVHYAALACMVLLRRCMSAHEGGANRRLRHASNAHHPV